MADPLTGLILNGRYRLEGRLGSGGMATVFRASRLGSLGGHVAIKILAPRYARTVVAKRFEREAMVVSRLSNPHSVRIHDFESFEIPGSAPPLFYIAMELVQGRTLDDVLDEQGRVNFLWGIDVMRQVARSLEEAHGLGIVHRDLKPSNIMVVQQRGATHIKVLDFGIAGMTASDAKPVEKLTHMGVISGTPEYMSPEQAAGDQNVGPASDIYTLGLIAWEMFAGRRPFQGDNPIDSLVQRLSNPAPPLAESCPDPEFPPALFHIVDSMLERDRAKRLSDAGELLDALSSFPTLQTTPGFIPPAELLARYSTSSITAVPDKQVAPKTTTANAVPVVDAGTARGGRAWPWIVGGLTVAGGAVAGIILLTSNQGVDAKPVVSGPVAATSGRGPAEDPAGLPVEIPWQKPALTTFVAFRSGTDGVTVRVDGPSPFPLLHQQLYLDVVLEERGETVSLTKPEAKIVFSANNHEAGRIEVRSEAEGRMSMRVSARPMAADYRIEVSGVDRGGRRIGFAILYDARRDGLTAP